jgi:hypothetical protein
MTPTCFNVTQGKKANTSISINRPLLCFTIGLAAMIHEPSKVSFGTSINDSILELQENLLVRLAETSVIGNGPRSEQAKVKPHLKHK